MLTYVEDRRRLLAAVLVAGLAAYLAWKVGQSGEQALQFAFNGLSVGAVYALLAMGFTLVYSTVWFFDLYYGAAAALGAYGVFYLRSQDVIAGQHSVNDPYVNAALAAVIAGVVAWLLYSGPYRSLRLHLNRVLLLAAGGLLAGGAGVYAAFVLAKPEDLNVNLAPAVGAAAAVGAALALRWAYRRIAGLTGPGRLPPAPLVAIGAGVAVAFGALCGFLTADTPGASLYLSWVVSCLLAGIVGLALYRGLYAYMREGARTPLVLLVASLGVLLAITALITIVFHSAPRPLPDAFGSNSWTIGGANIKAFNVFTVGVAVAGFLALLFLLKRTAFGKAVRAIGDDEEVSKVVGIDTTAVITIVFFIGAVYAALGGLLSGHDTAIFPRMGLLLLLKGWIASVVGGIGNLYGAIVGGFILGMIEQFAIWDLAGEWKDAVSFVLLILFLSFWPRGLLPRK